MMLAGQSSRGLNTSMLGRLVSVLAVAGIVGWSVTAAAVEVEYNLAPGSGLHTEVSGAFNQLRGTGQFPRWTSDGWSGHTPKVTQNKLVLEFSESSPGVIDPNGTVTVVALDFFHYIDAGVAGVADITGQTDWSWLTGAVGQLDGNGVVTTWNGTALDTGEIHNELHCQDIGMGGLCGLVGLPPSGTTATVHVDTTLPDPQAIDTLAVPDAGSLPMTFNNDYSEVSFEITINQASGRQYYSFITATAELPSSSETVQMVIIGVMALAGFFFLASRRGSVPFSS